MQDDSCWCSFSLRFGVEGRACSNFLACTVSPEYRPLVKALTLFFLVSVEFEASEPISYIMGLQSFYCSAGLYVVPCGSFQVAGRTFDRRAIIPWLDPLESNSSHKGLL